MKKTNNLKGQNMNKEEINIIIETLESFEKDNNISSRDDRLSRRGDKEASERIQNLISTNKKIRDIIKKLKEERA